jgi:hypothetical protein
MQSELPALEESKRLSRDKMANSHHLKQGGKLCWHYHITCRVNCAVNDDVFLTAESSGCRMPDYGVQVEAKAQQLILYIFPSFSFFYRHMVLSLAALSRTLSHVGSSRSELRDDDFSKLDSCL